MANSPYVLYAMQASLYSAKVRSWLTYNNVDFVEKSTGKKEYLEGVVPKLGRWIIPALVTPSGTLLQDGTDILDYLDSNVANKGSIFPECPTLRTIAHSFEIFGSEGLLRPAMHYRWDFDEHNLEFLRLSFRDLFPTSLSDDEASMMFEQSAAKRMRKVATAFGITPDTIAYIEKSYTEFLSLLNSHLSRYPYILGGRPTIADYALIGPMFAHLGRDPYPLAMMQKLAPSVYQWVERMNASHINDNPIYERLGDKLFEAANIPASLLALLKYIANEYLPEISSHVVHANKWLEQNINKQSAQGDNNNLNAQNSLGMAEFTLQNQGMKSIVLLYRFYLLQRLTDHYNTMSNEHKTLTNSIFGNASLSDLLHLSVKRRVIRKNYKEQWEV